MIDFTKFPLYTEYVMKEFTYNMNTKGYSVFNEFYSAEFCEHLKESLQKAVDEYVPLGSDRSFKDRYLLHDLMCRDFIFSKKLEDVRLQQIIASILGEYWIMYAYTSSSLPPNGVNYGSRIHVDSPRFITNYTTNLGVIWALDDFTNQNGGTKLLDASHHSSEIPSEEFFEKNCFQLNCKKGDLIIFNARVFHRAGENKTDQWRHSLTMNVCRPYMKQRCDWVRFIPTTITDKLNQQARRIIGFDTRLPTSLAEFYLEEDKRLYKPNQE